MIANLMMYSRPELVDAHEVYWDHIREQLNSAGIDSPVALSQDAEEFSVWNHPQLVLSQTCGMPYRLFLHGKVNLVGTPDFALEGCPPGYYNSAIITHKDDSGLPLASFEQKPFAYNQDISQSGYAAMINHTGDRGITLKQPVQTNSHLESARAVAEKRAAIASIDAMTWRLIQRYEPFAAQLSVLEWTRPTPGLPYITSITLDPAIIFTAVKSAIAELPTDTRQTLGIADLTSIPEQDYLSVPNPPGTCAAEPLR